MGSWTNSRALTGDNTKEKRALGLANFHFSDQVDRVFATEVPGIK